MDCHHSIANIDRLVVWNVLSLHNMIACASDSYKNLGTCIRITRNADGHLAVFLNREAHIVHVLGRHCVVEQCCCDLAIFGPSDLSAREQEIESRILVVIRPTLGSVIAM